jgi:hypothetical protein
MVMKLMMLWDVCVARIRYPYTCLGSNMTERNYLWASTRPSQPILPCKEISSTCKLSTNICLDKNMTCHKCTYFFQYYPKIHEAKDRRQTADLRLSATASLDWPGAVIFVLLLRMRCVPFMQYFNTAVRSRFSASDGDPLGTRELKMIWLDSVLSCNVYIMRILLHRLHVTEKSSYLLATNKMNYNDHNPHRSSHWVML